MSSQRDPRLPIRSQTDPLLNRIAAQETTGPGPLSPADIVTMVAQRLEVGGVPPVITPETLHEAKASATQLLATLGGLHPDDQTRPEMTPAPHGHQPRPRVEEHRRGL
jgi:hypothetical protein